MNKIYRMKGNIQVPAIQRRGNTPEIAEFVNNTTDPERAKWVIFEERRIDGILTLKERFGSRELQVRPYDYVYRDDRGEIGVMAVREFESIYAEFTPPGTSTDFRSVLQQILTMQDDESKRDLTPIQMLVEVNQLVIDALK